MANPNLLNATSIYGKNATETGDGSVQTVLTCATNKLIKITSINVHRTGGGGGGVCNINIAGVHVTGTTQPGQNGNYTYGSCYLTESQTVTFEASNDTYTIIISYEEIDDA